MAQANWFAASVGCSPGPNNHASGGVAEDLQREESWNEIPSDTLRKTKISWEAGGTCTFVHSLLTYGYVPLQQDRFLKTVSL